MNRRTLFLVLLLVLAVGLIVWSLRTPSLEKPKVQAPSPTPAPVTRSFTTLLASPSASLLTVGEESSFVVLIDTGENNIAAAQLEMVFNPEYLSISKIEPLSFFKNPTVLLKEIDNRTGTISYALGTTEVKQGKGELVRITIMGKKSTGTSSTPLTFLPKTSIGEIGNPASVLKEALGSSFVIK